MREIWLRANRRVLWIMVLPPCAVLLAGVLLLAVAAGRGFPWYYTLPGAVVSAAGVLLALGIGFLVSRPLLVYEPGYLRVHVGRWVAERIPIEAVEAFFRGSSQVVLNSGKPDELRTATIVARIAESATQWQQRHVAPFLGQWQDGYLTLRGTWCEPITGELLCELNRRLAAAHRAQRQPAGQESP